MKIILFGGSGCLGVELKKLNHEIICPSSEEVDINNLDETLHYVNFLKPDIIINAAAITDNRAVEKMAINAIETNIIGAANLSIICLYNNIRLVYISTDYIYKGDRGNYKETDEIQPFNLYSWTKLGGECSTVAVKNHLIIRTSFGKNNFEYNEAFTDKWTSKDYVDNISPLIYEAALSPLTGVLNLGTERKTLYSHAVERNETVKPVKLEDTNYFTPYDTSLNLQRWINYKSEKSIAKPHCNCRVCGSTNLTKYLDLGLMPLANNLEFTAQRAKNKERFPLQVLFCEFCGLSQLSVVIDPEKMFSYYTYRSSVNGGYVKHCRKMAKDLKSKLTPESFMIDIAGNDGTLLNQFRDEIGLKVLNIDPATNLAAIAESMGIESIADFWGYELANKILSSHGKADLITATNVFAHVDNVKEFINSAKILLKENGVLVLEFPYLVDFIENYEFDTIYFEHLSYFSVLPLGKLCSLTGMKMVDVEKQDIHGGTIRVTITHDESNIKVNSNVFDFISKEIELGYDRMEKYTNWSNDVHSIINNFSNKVLELKKQGFKVAAFAASAKGNTLLNCSGMNTDIIKYIADETPEKIGKYSPGTGIPIVNKQQLIKDVPDYLIILSWNFADEIIEKLNKIYNGKYIIPNEKTKNKEAEVRV
jgi:2-polyprenyl-3-methyl-5-hydroxy-6-metoxy-1,4-benzoquinol methylase